MRGSERARWPPLPRSDAVPQRSSRLRGRGGRIWLAADFSDAYTVGEGEQSVRGGTTVKGTCRYRFSLIFPESVIAVGAALADIPPHRSVTCGTIAYDS